MIEFLARQRKWHMLFDLSRVTSRLASLKGRVVAIDVVQTNVKSINKVNCSEDGQPGQLF